MVEERGLIRGGVPAQTRPVGVDVQGRGAKAEVGGGELEQVVSVRGWGVGEVAPVGRHGNAMWHGAVVLDEHAEAGVLSPAQDKARAGVRRACAREQSREISRTGLEGW